MVGVRGAAVRASGCEAVGGVVTESYDGSVSGGTGYLGAGCVAAGYEARVGAYLAIRVIQVVISEVVAEFRRESSLP
jgi:hypothetical protein